MLGFVYCLTNFAQALVTFTWPDMLQPQQVAHFLADKVNFTHTERRSKSYRDEELWPAIHGHGYGHKPTHSYLYLYLRSLLLAVLVIIRILQLTTSCISI